MDFDGVVIGAGHNGLTTAAYLARAGKKFDPVAVRKELGKCVVGEAPRFRLSVAGTAEGVRFFGPVNLDALPRQANRLEDVVASESAQSFPASDAPSWTTGAR